MVSPSRREFLSVVLGGVASTLGARSPFDPDSEFNFPHSRVIVPGTDEWAGERPDLSGGESVELDLEDDSTAVQRVWDPRTSNTSESQRLSSPIDPGELTSPDNVINMLYLEDDEGTLEYLFDFGVSEDLRHSLVDRLDRPGSNKYSRTMDEHGITVSCELIWSRETTLTVEIPYSLFASRRAEHTGRRFSAVPEPGENSFDRYTHEPLVDAVGGVVEPSDGERLSPYGTAAVIAEFVQSIPHATDWESQRRLSFLRTPEEALGELTADCKDAALLLYHLFDSFDFDPVFVFLVGDQIPAGEMDAPPVNRTTEEDGDGDDDEDKKDDADEKVHYPNHLAIALPKAQLEPFPEDVAGELDIMEYEGSEYVYVESTAQQPPGLSSDDRKKMHPILYHERSDLVTQHLPLL